ncbi:tRNA dihydrouridine(20/20a) synthase DusA [Polycyclovorans algicola]|uniref:tRNA dihydrouridine(20/20a) synthase DusA n=1 Tax=Polycyclovorans algicola TaxID=616992 RepID=UPI0004A77B13|nr:tRNA dihydrouridine(20/20a) synthase DusA [Polycyclovorans algicola]
MTVASPSPWRFCVAPMMDWTTSYCRQFHRVLTRHARLYTEMVTTGALLHGDAPRFLAHDPAEHPLALQLGGSEPDDLARAAELGGRAGYVEINLNCGCPSDRVQEGRFGACLMREPERVASAVKAMRGATDAAITVKHRVGVDDAEDYPFMRHFVETVAAEGCTVFIVHARKAWLQGLSPKENREVPPLTYEHVYRLKQDFPDLTVVINGGIETLDECSAHLAHVDGVMLGRAPYERPWLLADVDQRLFGTPNPVSTRDEALLKMAPLLDAMAARGEAANRLTRHLLGLYRGESGGKAFRRYLSEHGNRPQTAALLQQALQAVHPRA